MPDPYPLEASSLPPQCDHHKCLRHTTKAKVPPVEDYCLPQVGRSRAQGRPEVGAVGNREAGGSCPGMEGSCLHRRQRSTNSEGPQGVVGRVSRSRMAMGRYTEGNRIRLYPKFVAPPPGKRGALMAIIPILPPLLPPPLPHR